MRLARSFTVTSGPPRRDNTRVQLQGPPSTTAPGPLREGHTSRTLSVATRCSTALSYFQSGSHTFFRLVLGRGPPSVFVVRTKQRVLGSQSWCSDETRTSRPSRHLYMERP